MQRYGNDRRKFSSVHAQVYKHFNQGSHLFLLRKLRTKTLGRVVGRVAEYQSLIRTCFWRQTDAGYAIISILFHEAKAPL
jgi:hypothetical protein